MLHAWTKPDAGASEASLGAVEPITSRIAIARGDPAAEH
jgi:hypothetical protein